MSDLFEFLISEQNIWDAQIVGKNNFCKNPTNSDLFTQYFDFCIKVAKLPVEFETRSLFLNEAELALTIFSEKAEIDTEILKLISEKRSALAETAQLINNAEKEKSAQINKKIENNNDRILQNLAKLEGKFDLVTNQEILDDILSDMAKYEEELDKESFSDKQKIEYTALTREFSNLVSDAMERLGQEANKKYNQIATVSFKKAFDIFKSDEDKFKNHDASLYELVSNYLFSFDANKLFSETLVYYNNIYTYIFNKLDDEGKFRFTQFSFEVPKNR